MTTKKQADVLSQLRGFEAGIQKNLKTFTFMVAGKTYSGPQALAFVQSAVAAAQKVQEAHADLRDAILEQKQWTQQNAKTLKALQTMIALMYSDNAVTLADFAMEPKKPRAQMSNETLIRRAEKARATRAKRGTLGKRQRAAIKGNVTDVEITPVVAGKPTEPAGPKG